MMMMVEVVVVMVVAKTEQVLFMEGKTKPHDRKQQCSYSYPPSEISRKQEIKMLISVV